MNPERARELLGGLATGILTPEERQTLFEAALHDQSLFNEVADELEFAAFLQSPETRAQLANRIPDAGEAESGRRRWWVLRPRWLALTGALAACTVLFVVLRPRPAAIRDNEPVAVASRNAAPPAAPPVVTEPPAPEPAPKQAKTASPQLQSLDSRASNKPLQRPAEPMVARAAKEKDVADKAAVALEDAKSSPASVARRDAIPAAPPAPAAAPPPPSSGLGGVFGGQATARLEGTVHDTAGGAVANASIEIINSVSKTTTHTASDTAGRFAAPPLAPGAYTVTAAAPGFKKEERAGVNLAADQPAKIDIPLQVGAETQTVMISAAAPMVQQNVSGFLNAGSQVAVLDFANRTSQSQSGQQAADLLSSQLVDGGQVRVIDRQKVQQASQTDSQRQLNTREAAALGRRIGADAVIVGTVKSDRDNANVAVTAEVIDTRKAKPMARKIAANGTLKGATNQLGIALQSQLAAPLAGAVTTVDAATVVVSFPTGPEPRIGVRLDVFRGQRKIGELTLTSANGRSAAGKFSGSGTPRTGDRVTSSR